MKMCSEIFLHNVALPALKCRLKWKNILCDFKVKKRLSKKNAELGDNLEFKESAFQPVSTFTRT